jgi:hypothetical protein
MPPYIRKAHVLKKHLDTGLPDKINRSYYIISSWVDMMAIIKAVMIKHHKKQIRITSDREIRDVYVGSRSAQARAAMNDPDKIMNTLEDLMDLPNLVVVRLNELSYKNKAAPGALEEALSYRVDRDKPTWVISNVDRPFGNGSFAFSDTVWELLQSAFETIQVPRISPFTIIAPPEVRSVSLDPIDGSDEPDSEPPKPKPSKKKASRVRSVPDDEPVSGGIKMFGQGIQKSGKKFRN